MGGKLFGLHYIVTVVSLCQWLKAEQLPTATDCSYRALWRVKRGRVCVSCTREDRLSSPRVELCWNSVQHADRLAPGSTTTATYAACPSWLHRAR